MEDLRGGFRGVVIGEGEEVRARGDGVLAKRHRAHIAVAAVNASSGSGSWDARTQARDQPGGGAGPPGEQPEDERCVRAEEEEDGLPEEE